MGCFPIKGTNRMRQGAFDMDRWVIIGLNFYQWISTLGSFGLRSKKCHNNELKKVILL